MGCVYKAERNEKRNEMKNGTENKTRFIVMNNVIMIIMGMVLMFMERNYLMQ